MKITCIRSMGCFDDVLQQAIARWHQLTDPRTRPLECPTEGKPLLHQKTQVVPQHQFVDRVVLERDRPEIPPPLKIVGLPGFEGPLQAPIFRQRDVVGNAFAVINRHDLHPSFVEAVFLAASIQRESAVFSHRVGPLENPVLPGA